MLTGVGAARVNPIQRDQLEMKVTVIFVCIK